MEGGYVGILTVDLHLPEGHSLKSKRKELQRLKSSLARRHACAVAEVDHHDLWQRAGLTVAIVGRAAGETEDRLAEVSRALHADEAFQVVGEAREVVSADGEPALTWHHG